MKRHHLRVWASLLCLCLTLPCLLWLSSCRETGAAEKNAITSVQLAEGQVTVTASLTDGFLDGYTGKIVYLFELPSHLSVDADPNTLKPVAEAKPKPTISFTLPLTEGTRTRLYASYLVASYDEDTQRYTALTTPMALQNPSSAAPADSVTARPSGSLKGLANASPSDALYLGVAHAVVDVSLGDLMLSAWETDAVSYLWNGSTAYINGQRLAELDETIRIYTAAGVQVYLRFVLTELDTASTNLADAALCVPDADADAQGYAIHMASSATAARMEGFFDFIAARYTSANDAPTPAFILGYRVNDAATYANAGDMNLDAYVTNYEKLVRVAYTALRSHAADGRVYIALDDHRTASDLTGGWDVTQFLSAFAEEAALRGDYDWHISAELYADSSRVWEDTASDNGRYTVRNLSTLTDLLRGDRYTTAAGDTRRLLISGFTVPALDAKGHATDAAATDQAASYAYAYMTALANRGIEALIYSAHTDADISGHGLWSITEDGKADTARPLHTVFRRMDNTAAATLSTELSAVIGTPYTKLESALAGETRPITALTADGTVGPLAAAHRGAAALYTFGAGSTHGFTGAENLTYLELAPSKTPGVIGLHARFDRTEVSDPLLLTLTIPAAELLDGRELIFDLALNALDATADSAAPSLKLRLSRPVSGDPTAGGGAVVYEATAAALSLTDPQTVTFPIEELTALLAKEDTVTLTVFVDAPAGNAYELELTGVYVTGTAAAQGSPVAFIIVLLILSVVAVASAVVYLYLRHRRYSAQG